jgi:hypothetical protein
MIPLSARHIRGNIAARAARLVTAVRAVKTRIMTSSLSLA